MNSHLIIFVLALVGIADSLYLNYERRRKRAPICVIGDGCGIVWKSPHSKTFGISNEILGIIFFTTAAFLELYLLLDDASPLMVIGEYFLLFGGALMSTYFLYLQWRVIRAWCFWCTLSALTTWAMVITQYVF